MRPALRASGLSLTQDTPREWHSHKELFRESNICVTCRGLTGGMAAGASAPVRPPVFTVVEVGAQRAVPEQCCRSGRLLRPCGPRNDGSALPPSLGRGRCDHHQRFTGAKTDGGRGTVHRAPTILSPIRHPLPLGASAPSYPQDGASRDRRVGRCIRSGHDDGAATAPLRLLALACLRICGHARALDNPARFL